jgi:hypothetical protein
MLQHLYRVGETERRNRTAFFEELHETLRSRHPGDMPRWEKMWEDRITTMKSADGKTVSIFENEGSSTTSASIHLLHHALTHNKPAPPTHSAAYSKLRAQENRMETHVTATHEDDLAFIVDALRVDNERCSAP